MAASPETSGRDDVFDVTTGVPHAMASSTGSPKPSYRLGNTKALALLYKGRKILIGIDGSQEVHALGNAVFLRGGEYLLVEPARTPHVHEVMRQPSLNNRAHGRDHAGNVLSWLNCAYCKKVGIRYAMSLEHCRPLGRVIPGMEDSVNAAMKHFNTGGLDVICAYQVLPGSFRVREHQLSARDTARNG